MTVFFIVIFFIYFLFVVLLIAGLNRLFLSQQPNSSIIPQSITIIVPFRNEEKQLPCLIASLKNINYPKEKFEVILVDDHSQDNSCEVVNKLIAGLTNFKLIKVAAAGKKNAITEAIHNASGEIIITTDADCEVPNVWLTSINARFQNPTTEMVVGAVRINQTDSFFSKLQAIEFSSLIGSAAATLTLGFPGMCSGANLSYRKAAFAEVDGFNGNAHIASGDDEFLMRKVVEKFGANSLLFLNDSNAVVATCPQPSIKEFFMQRLRWAGKWRYNSSLSVKLLAVFIFVFQFSFLLLVVAFFFSMLNSLLIALLIVKILLEGIFLYKTSKFLKQNISIFAFLLLQVIYPLYTITVGLLSNVMDVSWKGRTIKR